MRWNSPARKKPWEWHRWFAWYPVRIPADIYENGQWVWWEWIESCVLTGYAGSSRYYRLPEPSPRDLAGHCGCLCHRAANVPHDGCCDKPNLDSVDYWTCQACGYDGPSGRCNCPQEPS